MSHGRLQQLNRPSPEIVILSAGRVAALLFALLLFGAVFIMHARLIFTQFSGDVSLFDTGWYAYLFGSGDPLLHNPSSVDPHRLSFYTFHLSPHIFLFGAALSYLFGLSGIEIYAYHQGFFFGLFFVSLYLIISTLPLGRRDWTVGAFSAIAIGTLSNVLLQAASYPHYEIALLALSSLALAAWLSDRYLIFAFCLLWLPLVREDGGFYAAFVCLTCIALEYSPSRKRDVRIVKLGVLTLLEIAASACAFLVKARYFPSTWFGFSFSFSGHSWDHVSSALIGERLLSLIRNPNSMPVLAGSAILAAFDLKYASGFVLLCPLYALYLLSVRPELGFFTLYYALPWLLPAVVWLVVFAKRSRTVAIAFPESIILLVLSMAITAPVLHVLRARGEFFDVVKAAFVQPVVSIPSMTEFALAVRQNYSRDARGGVSVESQCVSQGVAALIPNDVQPDELFYAANPSSDLAKCRTVLLLRGGSEYGHLRARAEAQEFTPEATRYNVELWLRNAK